MLCADYFNGFTSEFSSRECVYVNSLGEAIPPPRTREGSILANGQQPDEHTDVEMEDSSPVPRRPSDIQDPAVPKPPPSGPRPSWFSMGRPAAIEHNAAAAPSPLSRPLHPPAAEVRDANASSVSPHWGGHPVGPGGLNSNINDNFAENPPMPSTSEDTSHGRPSESVLYEEREREKRWRLKVVDLVLGDDALVEELLHIFLTKVPPYNMMFHQATFTYRRFTGESVPCLVYIMLAIAVRFLEHPLLVPYAADRRKDSKPFPCHLKGEPFADKAKTEVELWVRSHADIATLGRRASAWERTEWAMAMFLIKEYETCMGRARIALFHQGKA